MDGLEEKLNSILNDPKMMQQLMSMAQSLGANANQDSPGPQSKSEIDPAMLQQFVGLARQSGIDEQQQALLKALCPYLSRDRITKLEKAMRAAKMARIASVALGHRG